MDVIGSETAQRLTEQRRNAGLLLIVGVVGLAVFIVGTVRSGNRSERLESAGDRLDGQVVQVGGIGTLGGPAVEVEFEFEGARRLVIIQLSRPNWRYDPGEQVVVLIDPDDPSLVSLEGESNTSQAVQSLLAFSVIVGSVIFLAGVLALIQAGSQSAIVKKVSWRKASVLATAPSRDRRNSQWLFLIQEDSERYVMRSVVAARWQRPSSKARTTQVVEISGHLEERAVLRDPGTGRLISLAAPRGKGTRERWFARLGTPERAI